MAGEKPPGRRASAVRALAKFTGDGSRSLALRGGLAQFQSELNDHVLRDLLTWRADPELGRVLWALENHSSRKAFFDTYAEAVVARHLIQHGCEVRFEVPTPTGRRSDFEVRSRRHRFYLHLKRLDTDVASHHRLSVPARLRSLERINRPYVVQVRWHEGSTTAQLQRLVTQAGEFIAGAHIGDEMIARDDDGREIGGVRIIAPSPDQHVTVTIGLPDGFIDQAPRFRRLIHRAHQQFMPKETNVVVICSGHEDDVADFESALLGSHIERWDAFPPRGRRVAHGRAADGFWSDHRNADSRHACWFRLDAAAPALQPRLWTRDESPTGDGLDALLTALLGASVS